MIETQAYFENIKEKIAEQLLAAESSIFVAVAWFTDKDLYDILCQKARKGLVVRVIIVDDEINNGVYALDKKVLFDAGGSLYLVKNILMHNKFCIIDNNTVVNGSYNWTTTASKENLENITLIKGNQALINQFIQNFNDIIQHYSDQFEYDYERINLRIEIIILLLQLGDLVSVKSQVAILQEEFISNDFFLIPLIKSRLKV